MFRSPFNERIGFAYCKLNELASNQLRSEELACLSTNAVEKRRQEFMAGRAVARKALSGLGYDKPFAILRGRKGEPVWPDGILGSITHSGEWALAAVTCIENVRGLGIDLERLDKPRRADIIGHVCSAAEGHWVQELEKERHQRLVSIFSAKESIYKALFPLVRERLGFKDVELKWEDGEFTAQLTRTISAEISESMILTVGVELYPDYVFTHCLI